MKKTFVIITLVGVAIVFVGIVASMLGAGYKPTGFFVAVGGFIATIASVIACGSDK